ERVEVEKFIVGGRRIYFEIPRMNDDAERSVYGESDAIDQAVSNPDGVNGESSSLKALIWAHFAEIGVIQESMLVEFVFDISKSELGAPHRNFQLGEEPGKRSNVV